MYDSTRPNAPPVLWVVAFTVIRFRRNQMGCPSPGWRKQARSGVSVDDVIGSLAVEWRCLIALTCNYGTTVYFVRMPVKRLRAAAAAPRETARRPGQRRRTRKAIVDAT